MARKKASVDRVVNITRGQGCGAVVLQLLGILFLLLLIAQFLG